jgi:hypothetical protein
MEFESIEEYIKHQVEEGYLHPDGATKKCINCDGEKFKEVNVDRLDGWRDILEYDVQCENCDNIVGHWAYGHWQL